MCNACHMHICTGLVGPKRGKVKKPLVFKAFLKGQSGHGDARESLQRSEPSNFLDTLEPLSGDFGGTSGQLWGHFEHIDVEIHV